MSLNYKGDCPIIPDNIFGIHKAIRCHTQIIRRIPALTMVALSAPTKQRAG